MKLITPFLLLVPLQVFAATDHPTQPTRTAGFAPTSLSGSILSAIVRGGSGSMAKSGSFKLSYGDQGQTHLTNTSGEVSGSRDGTYVYRKTAPNVGVLEEDIVGYPQHLTTTLTFSDGANGIAVANFGNGRGSQTFAFNLQALGKLDRPESAWTSTTQAGFAANPTAESAELSSADRLPDGLENKEMLVAVVTTGPAYQRLIEANTYLLVNLKQDPEDKRLNLPPGTKSYRGQVRFANGAQTPYSGCQILYLKKDSARCDLTLIFSALREQVYAQSSLLLEVSCDRINHGFGQGYFNAGFLGVQPTANKSLNEIAIRATNGALDLAEYGGRAATLVKDPNINWLADRATFVRANLENESPAEMRRAGEYLCFGTDWVTEGTRGFNLLVKAADQGDVRAMTLVGLAYQRGRGCAQSVEQAYKYFEMAGKHGDGPGQYLFTTEIADGNRWFAGQPYIDAAFARAYQLCLAQRENGDSFALTCNAQMELAGRGVLRDAQVAVQNLETAADEGSRQAMELLGKYYRELPPPLPVAVSPSLAEMQVAPTPQPNLVQRDGKFSLDRQAAVYVASESLGPFNWEMNMEVKTTKGGYGLWFNGRQIDGKFDAFGIQYESETGKIYEMHYPNWDQAVRLLTTEVVDAEWHHWRFEMRDRVFEARFDGRLVVKLTAAANLNGAFGFRTWNGCAVEVRLVNNADNDTQARHWFERAIALGNSSAMMQLGELYVSGSHVEKDPARAFALFSQAAAANDFAGIYRVAECYRDGVGVTQDLQMAMAWFDKGIAMGDSECMFGLASVLDRNGDDPGKIKRATELYNRAAEMGNGHAMISLAVRYEVGYGLPRNKPEALDWFRHALTTPTLSYGERERAHANIQQLEAEQVEALMEVASLVGAILPSDSGPRSQQSTNAEARQQQKDYWESRAAVDGPGSYAAQTAKEY